jgi:hypothetical protein
MSSVYSGLGMKNALFGKWPEVTNDRTYASLSTFCSRLAVSALNS